MSGDIYNLTGQGPQQPPLDKNSYLWFKHEVDLEISWRAFNLIFFLGIYASTTA